MNIYEKMGKARLELQQMNLRKSGQNKFAGYQYYELADYLPTINKIMDSHKMIAMVSFTAELATMTVLNIEKPDEFIVFTSPMRDANLKGSHPIQNLGAVETYQRRYLYQVAFEIVEHDALDASMNPDVPAEATPEQIVAIETYLDTFSDNPKAVSWLNEQLKKPLTKADADKVLQHCKARAK